VSKLKPSSVLAVFTCIAVLLSGCMRLMERDFEKALEVTTIDIGMPSTVAKTVELPLGEADLRFVVPDYDCAQPLNASITVKVQLADGKQKQRIVNLSELVWPQSGTECRAIGYLRSDHPDSARPFAMKISTKSNPVQFSIAVTLAANPARQLRLWVVYNDREPVDRMLQTTGNEL